MSAEAEIEKFKGGWSARVHVSSDCGRGFTESDWFFTRRGAERWARRVMRNGTRKPVKYRLNQDGERLGD